MAAPGGSMAATGGSMTATGGSVSGNVGQEQESRQRSPEVVLVKLMHLRLPLVLTAC